MQRLRPRPVREGRTSLIFRCRERPLEDKREDDGFDVGEQGGDAEVDVIVYHFRRGGEEFAV